MPEQYFEPAEVYENGVKLSPSVLADRQKEAEQQAAAAQAQQAAKAQQAAAKAAAAAEKKRIANQQAALNKIPKVSAPATPAKVIPNPFAGAPSSATIAAQKAEAEAKQRAANQQAAFNNIPKVSPLTGMKKGGSVSKGSSASKRADGVAQRGKTRGKMC